MFAETFFLVDHLTPEMRATGPEETFLRSNVRCLNIARVLDIRHFVSYSLRVGIESSYWFKGTVGGAGNL